jgi:hypothetical protein
MLIRVYALLLLLLVLLLGLVPASFAQEVGSDDSTDAAIVDPLDIPQGGGLPTPTPVAAPSADILAAGNPPLTRLTVDHFVGFFMWVLDAPLTQTQRQDLEDAAVQTWRSGESTSVAAIVQMADAYQKLARLGETQRIQLRDQLQPQLLDQARSQPDDEFSRWLVDVYTSAHMPIASGTPPLTREVSDANAEVTYFVLKVVATGDGSIDGLKLDQSLLDNWAASVARDYPSYAADQQQMLARMPLFRAAMVEGWPQLSADDRARLRDQWRPIAQNWLSGTTCEAFINLADGNLVEPTDANKQRYAECNPDAAASAPAPQVSRAQSQAAYEQAMAKLQASHNAYVGISNALLTSHVATMNMINNFGDSPYYYVVK